MNQNNDSQQPRRTIRIKCLVLGAAGAGKTSLLRRYFHNKFDIARIPTLGCDFFTARVTDTCSLLPPQQQATTPTVWVSLQMWDTPGRERIALERRQSHKYASSFGHDFFRKADAIMLVYDMTSSTSFTQLLKWYADVLELQNNSDQPPLPILIVANKLDLLQNHPERTPHPRRRKAQRDVMGLKGNFRGKDFHYEYQVSPLPRNSSETISPSSNHSFRKKKKMTEKKQDNRRMEISSYLVCRDKNWTDDWSYLASLLNSEDLSHPDRDLVLLWCMRNGLTHCEASAATGEGVSEAMDTLLCLALASTKEPEPTSSSVPTTRYQERLDFHERYASKEDNCFAFFTLRPLLQFFRK
jgi:small GTP-binding protein